MSHKKPDFSLYAKTLPNGVQLIALSMEKANYVAFTVGIRGGSRDDPRDKPGTAHFLEHMTLVMTKKRPRTRTLLRALDAVGGASNMLTYADKTTLTMNVIPEDVPRAAELIFDIVHNAKWNSTQLACEKNGIISELNENADNPEEYNGVLLSEMLFEGSSLAHNAEGSAKSVAAITHRDLQAFKDMHYCGANIVICVVGAISKRDIDRLVVPVFSKLEAGSRVAVSKFVITQTEPRIHTCERNFKQLWFALGFTFGGMSQKEILTLDVITSMIGDNAWSSLFFSKIRQPGLAYDVSIVTQVFQDVGCATITGSTSHAKDKDVLRKIFSLLKRVKTNVSSEELQFFKDYMCRQLTLDAASPGFHAADVLEEYMRGREILTPAEQIAAVQAVNRKSFLEVTNKVFDFSRTNLSVLGPCRSPNVYRRIIEEFL